MTVRIAWIDNPPRKAAIDTVTGEVTLLPHSFNPGPYPGDTYPSADVFFTEGATRTVLEFTPEVQQEIVEEGEVAHLALTATMYTESSAICHAAANFATWIIDEAPHKISHHLQTGDIVTLAGFGAASGYNGAGQVVEVINATDFHVLRQDGTACHGYAPVSTDDDQLGTLACTAPVTCTVGAGAADCSGGGHDAVFTHAGIRVFLGGESIDLSGFGRPEYNVEGTTIASVLSPTTFTVTGDGCDGILKYTADAVEMGQLTLHLTYNTVLATKSLTELCAGPAQFTSDGVHGLVAEALVTLSGFGSGTGYNGTYTVSAGAGSETDKIEVWSGTTFALWGACNTYVPYVEGVTGQAGYLTMAPEPIDDEEGGDGDPGDDPEVPPPPGGDM